LTNFPRKWVEEAMKKFPTSLDKARKWLEGEREKLGEREEDKLMAEEGEEFFANRYFPADNTGCSSGDYGFFQPRGHPRQSSHARQQQLQEAKFNYIQKACAANTEKVLHLIQYYERALVVYYSRAILLKVIQEHFAKNDFFLDNDTTTTTTSSTAPSLGSILSPANLFRFLHLIVTTNAETKSTWEDLLISVIEQTSDQDLEIATTTTTTTAEEEKVAGGEELVELDSVAKKRRDRKRSKRLLQLEKRKEEEQEEGNAEGEEKEESEDPVQEQKSQDVALLSAQLLEECISQLTRLLVNNYSCNLKEGKPVPMSEETMLYDGHLSYATWLLSFLPKESQQIQQPSEEQQQRQQQQQQQQTNKPTKTKTKTKTHRHTQNSKKKA